MSYCENPDFTCSLCVVGAIIKEIPPSQLLDLRIVWFLFSTSAMSLLYECINTVIAGKSILSVLFSILVYM